MLGSPLLGTAVGLVLLFATTALLCSGITESISTLFQMRACYLLTGMRAMLDAQDTDPPPAAPGTPSAVQPETSEAAPPSVGKAAPAPPGVSAKGSLHRQWPPPTPVRSAKARPQRSECVTKELTALGAAGLPVANRRAARLTRLSPPRASLRRPARCRSWTRCSSWSGGRSPRSRCRSGRRSGSRRCRGWGHCAAPAHPPRRPRHRPEASRPGKHGARRWRTMLP